MINQACEKLNNELAEIKNNKLFAKAIHSYITQRCNSESGFAERVNIEGKELRKCLTYIINFARKQQEGNYVALPDDVVYEKAGEYYELDQIEEEDVTPKHTVVAQAPRPPKSGTNPKEMAKEAKVGKEKEAEQLSLFDFS